MTSLLKTLFFHNLWLYSCVITRQIKSIKMLDKRKGNLLSMTQQTKIKQTGKNNSKISNTRNTLPRIGSTKCVTFPLHLPLPARSLCGTLWMALFYEGCYSIIKHIFKKILLAPKLRCASLNKLQVTALSIYQEACWVRIVLLPHCPCEIPFTMLAVLLLLELQ